MRFELDADIIKTETLYFTCPDLCYCDIALFNKDGSVDIVSYKGEGENWFPNVKEFNNWKMEYIK